MVEHSLGITAVFRTDLSVADDIQELSLKAGNDHAIVIAVGNKQPPARFIGHNFSGKLERRWFGFLAF